MAAQLLDFAATAPLTLTSRLLILCYAVPQLANTFI